MERLTKRNLHGIPYYPECFNKCAGKGPSIKCHCCYFEHEIIIKLAEYEDLEEQGRLIKLPCKVGDTVYYIDDGEIYWDKVYSIDLRKEKGEFVFCIGCMDYKEEDFGKIAFTSKAEAEKALEEMGE